MGQMSWNDSSPPTPPGWDTPGALPQGGTGTITVIGAYNLGIKQDLINLAVQTLKHNIDSTCEAWLETGFVKDIDKFISDLVDNALIGHGTITTTTQGQTINAVTSPAPAPGFSIVINDNGAFFSPSVTTDTGNISGGSPLAQAFILLHEFAHANIVPGFLNDANNAGFGALNNTTIEQQCAGTLSKK